MVLFKTFNDLGQTIIMVTHSIKSASKAKKVLFLKDGVIGATLEKENADPEPQSVFEPVAETSETVDEDELSRLSVKEDDIW